jgi:hypothetical protein
MEEQAPPPAPAEASPAAGGVAQKTDEEKAGERAKVTAHLRQLIEHVCGKRFGGVPADLAAILTQEENLLMLSRWYIGAGSLTADDFVALVHAPRPEQ